MNADIIAFYIPRQFPELPGLTTNVEFGMYLAKRPEKVKLCCPENSERNEYLKWLYEKEQPNEKIYKNLEEFLVSIIKEL